MPSLRPSSSRVRFRHVVCALAVLAGLLNAQASSLAAPASAAEPAITESGPDSRSVERLYLAYFGRLPDAGGLAFWTASMGAGTTLGQVSQQFSLSPEFRDTYGDLDAAAFVALVYLNVLDRPAEGEGAAFWTSEITSGRRTRGQVMIGFSDSAEFKDSTGVVADPLSGPDPRSVERLFLAYFERDADAGGLAFWQGAWDRGRSLESISDAFTESPEFVSTYGDLGDAAFVDLVYQNVLGRPGDAGGRAHWIAQLGNGNETRGSVMVRFSDSAEFKKASDVYGPRPAVPQPEAVQNPGNPEGTATVPSAAQAVDVSQPDHVVGNGSPASCTSEAVVAAVALGGTITFNCGPDPITIPMTATAQVFNNQNPDVVIDGGGLVTLSGQGQRRILYMNTCDQNLVWTTPHCQNQDHPRLTVQNIAFDNGVTTNADPDSGNGGGGGAIFVRGGRFKAVNTIFTNNRCAPTGPDTAGGGLRVLSQFNDQPVYVVNSTFGGAGAGNSCSNGGALSTIGSSYTILNSVFTHNEATGNGANPAQPGTPGGGNGGAIANDGGTYHLVVDGSIITDNHANEGGGGIFYVSNNLQGTMTIRNTTMARNPSDQFETAGLPGIFYLGNGPAIVTGSSIS